MSRDKNMFDFEKEYQQKDAPVITLELKPVQISSSLTRVGPACTLPFPWPNKSYQILKSTTDRLFRWHAGFLTPWLNCARSHRKAFQWECIRFGQ